MPEIKFKSWTDSSANILAIFLTYIFFLITVGFEDLQNNKFSEALEARDQGLLLKHFGQCPKNHGTGWTHLVG